MKVRPSTTLIVVTYIIAVLLTAVIAYLGFSSKLKSDAWMIAFLVPAVMMLAAAWKHMRAAFTIMELAGDRLKFESGMLSKTTRSVPLSKVQDITVSQTISQRLLGLGDLTIETAGETGRLIMQEISSPRVVAEKILDRVAEMNPNRKTS
jgi:uncharacterized membrane protein YdbT with pleckstrin-like domain